MYGVTFILRFHYATQFRQFSFEFVYYLLMIADSDDSSETDTEELVRQEREKRIEAEARRKVVEEARSNAAYLMRLVAQEKEAKAQQQREREAKTREEERRQREREEAKRWEEEKRQREREAERRQREKETQRRDEGRRQKDHANHTQAQNDIIVLDKGDIMEELDVGSNTEVFALPKSSRQASTSEGMYSPDMSVAVQGSPSSVSKKSTRLLPSRWVAVVETYYSYLKLLV